MGRTSIILFLFVCLSACGTGPAERVQADSSMTSASLGKVEAPAVVNTDTTTAAPVAVVDTAAKSTAAPAPAKLGH